MLNKLQVTMLVGLVLGVVRAFFPQLEVPEAFETALEMLVNSLFVIVPVFMGWFARESSKKVKKLDLKFPVVVIGMLALALAGSPVQAQEIELGGGVVVNDEEALDVSDARGFVALTGIEIPLPGDTYTGILFEAGYSSALLWSVWSVSETEINRVIAGGHVRIAKGGPDGGSAFDIAARVVGGYRVTPDLAFRSYWLETGTPFQFAVSWHFEFPGFGDGG